MAAAPGFPAGTSFTASPASVDPAAKPVSPGFDSVIARISKVVLLPSKEGDGPDPGGEVIATDSGTGPDGAVVSGPVEQDVDLLHLPSGQKIARFLNKLFDVPAGTYGKIRVYYSDLYGVRGTEKIPFHPTANSHFDVHFVGSDLVIPVTTDPDGGIRLYDVTITFVGLKIVENKNKVLMRPQVFATVGTVVQYVISGFADNVNILPETFDVITDGGRSFHTMFSLNDNVTKWAFKDNETKQQVALDNNLLGIAALRDGSLVAVYGAFTGIDTLFADNVVIIFTDSIKNTVAPGDEPPSGWQLVDTLEFFEFRFSGDNVVIPMPSRTEARYDNNAIQDPPLSDAIIMDNTCVRARGYFFPEEIEAYWISWVSNEPCPLEP